MTDKRYSDEIENIREKNRVLLLSKWADWTIIDSF